MERRRSTRRLHFRRPRLEFSGPERISAEATGIDGTDPVWLELPESRRGGRGLLRLVEIERFRNGSYIANALTRAGRDIVTRYKLADDDII